MRLLLLAAGLLALASPAAADCAPERMVRVVTRNVTPGVPPGHFSAQPLVMHRQGSKYLRTEEAPDPAQGVHLMIIVAEPHIWFVNKADRTGKHILDVNPPTTAHAPIISGASVPAAFGRLEFGCEAAFVRAFAPKAEGKRQVNGREAELHVLREGEHRLEVLMRGDRPEQVGYYRGDEAMLVVGYDAYEPGLPFDPMLFARPPGIDYTEEAPASDPPAPELKRARPVEA